MPPRRQVTSNESDTSDKNSKTAKNVEKTATKGRKAHKLDHSEAEVYHETDQDPSLVDVLPDDVLVQVLSLLDPGSVLRARMACRRLRDLGAHPDVWRRRRLALRRLGRPLCEAVLRAAPCLRALDLLYLRNHGGGALRQLLRTTACALEELRVYLAHTKDSELAFYANQLRLGRVRAVTLLMNRDGAQWEEWRPCHVDLVRRVLTAPRVADLAVLCYSMPPAGLADRVLPTADAAQASSSDGNPGDDDDGEPSTTSAPPAASVRRLRLEHAKPLLFPEACVDYLLRTHAATLEEVDLCKGAAEPSAAGTAALAGAPRLRALRCRGWPGLARLPADGPLASLTLYDHVGPEATAYLRAATLLERLEVEVDGRLAGEACGAVASAASSGRSALRDVAVGPPRRDDVFQSACEDKVVELSALARALPSLRHLTSLTVCFAPREGFYAALSARAVPQLRLLRVNLWFQQCAHDWMHAQGVLGLLEGLPELRVVAGKADRCGDRRAASWLPPQSKTPCLPCQRRCHEVVVADRRNCCCDSVRVSHLATCCSGSEPVNRRLMAENAVEVITYEWVTRTTDAGLPE